MSLTAAGHAQCAQVQRRSLPGSLAERQLRRFCHGSHIHWAERRVHTGAAAVRWLHALNCVPVAHRPCGFMGMLLGLL